MDCPFCPIEKKTDWFLHDVVNDIVACEDLHKRGYKYRILVVGSGPRWHRPWENYTDEERFLLLSLGGAIASYHVRIGKAKEAVKVDIEHFSFPEHGHVQGCMR